MIRLFNGKEPTIADSAFVDETACIIGDVEIGDESSVWPGAVLRGDMGKITVGKQTIIEDNCVIHTGTPRSDMGDVRIGDRVIIGHGAVLNCRSVGSYVLVGMNATLLHGVEIGDYCIIGAASLVVDEQKIPNHSLVLGVPGQIKGRPSDRQLWWIQEAYKDYEELIKRYKNEIR
jgi:carbonic anhydrase/acetyltransferase-like protein (isoleucine patch superfamily)